MTDNLAAPERFVTDRLIVRKPVLGDATNLFEAYAQDNQVTRFLTWKVHTDIEETVSFLKFCRDAWATAEHFAYVLEPRSDSGMPFGMIDMRPKAETVQFGYVLARSAWGKGYMTEALKCLVDWSLTQPGIWRASAFCDVENPASGRVMEKAGMSFEGVLHRYSCHPNVADAPRDCRMYAKVK